MNSIDFQTGEGLFNLLINKKRELINLNQIPKKKDKHKYPLKKYPFNIPDDWFWCYLSDISIIQEGPGIRKHQYQKEGVQFLTVTNILEGSVDLNKSEKFISLDEFKTKYQHFKINKGDIVTACSGATWGKSAIYDSDQLLLLNTSTLRLRFFDDIGLNKYLYYLTKSDFFKRNLASHSTGQQPNYGYSHYSKIPIPLPPLSEQKRIVAILDEAFEAIEKTIANTEKNLQNAQELFESYLQQVFENKGEDWEWKHLNQISENLDSKRIPITKSKRTSGEIPYYGASGIVDYVDDFIFDGDLLCVSEDGANLLARTYPIAFSISGKTWVNNHAHVLKFNSMTNQKFIEYYINSIRIDDFVSGMAQPKLNQKNLNRIPVPNPKLQEQEIILNGINGIRGHTENLRVQYQNKLTSLEELKKTILQKAFQGELNTEKELEFT